MTLEPTSAASLKSSLNRVLTQESLRNERRIAYARAVMLCISSTLDVLVFFFPKTLLGQDSVPPSIALIGCSASLLAILITVLLHRQLGMRWLRRLQRVIPFFDGALLAVFITNIFQVLGAVQPQIITNITAFCCLLAVSGGIRFSQRASAVTIALAMVNFAYAAYLFELDLTVSLFALITILGIGLLGLFISGIVRRHIKNETGRQLITRFLPSTLVETVFEDPLQLLEQPRLCEVTVMFTDLRGFTRYSEQLDPASVLQFLSRFQGCLSAIVERHQGCVVTFMGDGMMAVFGVPQPLSNHAEKALEAAIAMIHEVPTISPLAMGIGLHSGPVVAGCLGTDGHLEFSVIGDTVNVASRIESLTKEVGQPLLISETTQGYLQNLSLRSLGPMNLRGRQETLEMFTI